MNRSTTSDILVMMFLIVMWIIVFTYSFGGYINSRVEESNKTNKQSNVIEEKVCLGNYSQDQMISDINKLKETVKKLKHNIIINRTAFVTVTGYHPKSRGINSDSNPGMTATMTRPISGRTAALSTSLVRKGWLGKKIYVEGFGVFVCLDRMNVDLEGDRIDLCTGSLKDANKIGRNEDVFVSIVD